MPYADTETVILPLFITLLCMGCAWYEIIKRKRPKRGDKQDKMSVQSYRVYNWNNVNQEKSNTNELHKPRQLNTPNSKFREPKQQHDVLSCLKRDISACNSLRWKSD